MHSTASSKNPLTYSNGHNNLHNNNKYNGGSKYTNKKIEIRRGPEIYPDPKFYAKDGGFERVDDIFDSGFDGYFHDHDNSDRKYIKHDDPKPKLPILIPPKLKVYNGPIIYPENDNGYIASNYDDPYGHDRYDDNGYANKNYRGYVEAKKTPGGPFYQKSKSYKDHWNQMYRPHVIKRRLAGAILYFTSTNLLAHNIF